MDPPNDPPHRPGFASELLTVLREISTKLDALRAQVAAISTSRPAAAIDPTRDLDELETVDLRERLEEARRQKQAYDVLDVRLVLATRLRDAERFLLDQELAIWFTRHFQDALRAGQAAIVAGAIERAVNEIGDIPEMQLLAEALPTVLRSVGLYLDAKAEDVERDEPT